jgi:hypothetical protein
LAKIPKAGTVWEGERNIMNRVRGMVVLAVEDHGEAWYVNPRDNRRYYLGRPDDAFRIMRERGLGITSSQLEQINPSVEISFMNVGGSSEYVEIRNSGRKSVSLGGWRVQNNAGEHIVIAHGTTLPPDGRLHVVGNIWNDVADQAMLIGTTGSRIDRYSYAAADEAKMARDLPFTTQAPHGNWVPPYHEACEEAVLTMVDHYYRGVGLSRDEANVGILRLVSWQIRELGFYEDTGVGDTGRMAQEVLGLRTRVITHDISVDRLRELVSQGKPIAVPVSGRDLGNSHFLPPGPIYHMVLIVGVSGDHFLVHEPGTRYGAHYRYQQDAFVRVIHDLTIPESAIRTGSPAVLVIDQLK